MSGNILYINSCVMTNGPARWSGAAAESGEDVCVERPLQSGRIFVPHVNVHQRGISENEIFRKIR